MSKTTVIKDKMEFDYRKNEVYNETLSELKVLKEYSNFCFYPNHDKKKIQKKLDKLIKKVEENDLEIYEE